MAIDNQNIGQIWLILIILIIVNGQEGCGEVRTSFSVLCENVGHSQNV